MPQVDDTPAQSRLAAIGLRLSDLIVLLSGASLFAALGLTPLGSIVLGMGLPTTAAYVVLAALGAPALVELGAPLLAAHLFIFYFGFGILFYFCFGIFFIIFFYFGIFFIIFFFSRRKR